MNDKRRGRTTILLLLILGSLILLSNAIFTLQLFSTQYGLGLGAIVQSRTDFTNVTQQLSLLATQLTATYQSILESYLNAGIATMLIIIALALYLKRNESQFLKKRYTLVHAGLTLIYILIFFIMRSTFNLTFYKLQLYFVYVGIALLIFVDAYVELEVNYAKKETRHKQKAEINLDPDTPYTNLIKIKEELFSQLEGEIKIVDKHFNSVAINNLNRLLSDNPKIRSVLVITSTEMLDSKFANNYNDLKAELANKRIGFDIKIMNEEDARAQHERYVMDNSMAFKVPPFNIINKKSEHILKIKLKDAKQRFSYLTFRSVKFENYGKRGEQQTNK